MKWKKSNFAGDQGNIMLLGIGFIGICLLALAVITDASSAFIQQRELQAQADSIALAGAQGIDLAQYYETGATEATRLDPANVAALVSDHFTASTDSASIYSASQVPAPTMAFTSTPSGVFVTLTAPLRLTFFDALAFEPIKVSAAARLDYRGN